MRRAALVVADGAIDWLALPAMDAPPLCAALLDPAAGGSIDLTPTVPFDVSRRYVNDTLVLQTTFRTSEGTVRATDALNRGAAGELPWAELARRIDVDDGAVPMRWSVRPGHGLAGLRPRCHLQAGQIRILVGERELAVITDGLGEPVLDARGVEGTVIARAGWSALLAVVAAQNEPVHVPAAGQMQLGCFGDLLDAVVRYTGAGGCLEAGTSALVGTLADRVCELWRSPDAGLWELGDLRLYTISKVA
jgi:hypothetical protein